MRFPKRLALYMGLGVILGCVVIPDTFEAHIFVDIRHIEQQAASVLDYVSGQSDTIEPVTEGAPDEQAEDGQSSFLQRAIELLDPVKVAYAQELKSTSPLVKQIADRMRERFDEVQALKKTGAVGENNRGFLEMIKPGNLSGDEAKNEAQRLIAADNEDRKALYAEVARLNRGENVSVSTVERVYAKERLDRAKSGEWVQLPPEGEWFDTATGSTLEGGREVTRR